MRGDGRLALWHDCAAGSEAIFEAWYKTEHLRERLSVPGFLRGRRFEAVGEAPRYFTYYVTAGPEVLASAAYRARLDDPTPETRRIMSSVMQNLSRTICRVSYAAGSQHGAWAVTALGAEAPDIATLAQEPGIARAEIWLAIDHDSPIAREEAIRGGDTRIDKCLLVETLRAQDAERIAGSLPGARIWCLLCDLNAGDLV